MEILKTIGILVLIILFLPLILKVVLGLLNITVGFVFLGIRVAAAVLIIYLIYRGFKAVTQD